ncbi:MAG: DDE-type integrase/transposase/recombinase [Bacteroidetes bacterium]|nr:DDE-type integrase/transposase/recombinase [Bacteroidota bacterium]
MKKKSNAKQTIRNKKQVKKANTGRRYSKSEKKRILKDSESKTLQEINDIYGVYPETIRRWKIREKYLNNNNEDKNEGSYSGTHPNWERVLNIWKSRPGLGPLQITNQMKREKIRINVGTVRLIMEENGYTPPKTIIKETDDRRYEAVRPLELVHMDFKHFYINKQKVYLLLMQDDFSRFIMGYKTTDSENMKAVIEVFESAVNRHGKMQTLITDGGSAFYSWNGVNKFQRLISEEYGVDHIKAGSCRSNGKIESVNKQIEKELLRIETFSNLDDMDAGICEWIRFYNFERTHMGLPLATVPADRFMPCWNQTSVSEQQSTPSFIEQLKNSKDDKELWVEILKIAVKKIN